MDLQSAANEWMQSAYQVLTESLKLGFTLSTGAVVLFVHLLGEVKLPRSLTLLIGLSTICFGLSAVLCIHALLLTVPVHSNMGLSLIGGDEEAKQQYNQWRNRALDEVKKAAERTEKLFKGGIVFAVLSVCEIVVLRFIFK